MVSPYVDFYSSLQLLMTCHTLPRSGQSGDDLYTAAHRALHEAIDADERLFDAMRSAALLVSWLMAKGKYPVVIGGH